MIRRFLSIILPAFAALPALAQTPEYIRADSAAARSAFGVTIAAKIFSDAYTPLRRDVVQKSIARIPAYTCGKEPMMALAFVVPYPIKPGAVSWVEKIFVDCQPMAQRNFLAILEGDHPRMIELLPGATAADPTLQRDAFAGSSAA